MESSRDTTFDILKGISIIEVILHHLLSHSARKYAEDDSTAWWVMMVTNRVLHFAVPTFLFVSALLLARSLARKPKPDWKRFFARRAERTLWPYLVWTAIYIIFRLTILRAESDVMSVSLHTPFGTFTLPALLGKFSEWRRNLLLGKAYFHLYFLSVLLQFSLLFPLLFLFMRRFHLTWGGVLLLSILLQGLAFRLHSAYLQPVLGFTMPGSLILSYILPILFGMWVGLYWERWGVVWKNGKALFWLLMLGGFAAYGTEAVRQLLGYKINSLLHNSGAILYATGMAILLLGWTTEMNKSTRMAQILARIGDWSLPLFLIHPMILYLLSGPKISGFIARLPVPVLWVALFVFTLTWGITLLTRKLRLDYLLFGRSLASNQSSA